MNNKGHITIFLSLIILILISFFAAIVESTRIISSKTKAQQISDISIDACFSKYAKELFDEYGIMGLWKSKSKILNDYNNYVSKDLDRTKDLLGLSILESDIVDVEYLAENNGENYIVQVDKLMQYKITQDIINKLLLKINGIEKSDAVSKVLDEVKKYQDIVTSIDEDVSTVYENVELISEDINEIQTIIEDVNSYHKQIVEYKGNRKGLIRLKGLYEDCIQRLSAYIEEIDMCIDDICTYEKDYEYYTKLASNGIKNMNKVLDDVKEDCNEDIYNALEEIVSEYDTQIVDLDKDYFNMVHCKKEADKLKKYCEDIKEFLDMANTGIKNDSFTNDMFINISIPFLNEFEVFYDSSGTEGKKSLLTKITNIFSDGLLSLVVEDVDKLSTKNIDTNKVLSKRIKYSSNYNYRGYKSINEQIRKLLYTQYLFDYFSNYLTDTEDKPLNFEIEYIIAGKNSDRKNMECVISEIIALREGLNMAYIVTDKEKLLEAEGMAASIVGSTGIAPLITITKWIIIGAWVTAESVVDVRLLLKGEEVSLIKTKSEWNTSIASLKKFNAKQYKNKKKKNSISFGYIDYLRILLFIQNPVKQAYRTMDIIELNICDKYNDNFKLDECVYKVQINSKYKVKELFSGGISRNIYNLEIFSEMEY